MLKMSHMLIFNSIYNLLNLYINKDYKLETQKNNKKK